MKSFSIFFILPFVVQAVVIALDEWVFHVKRGLPRWERIGHPIDTASLLICFGFLLLVPFSGSALKWYGALAVLSCLLVTKDEWVHKEVCPASEQWLHALLFLNHPIVLTTAGLIWWRMGDLNAPAWLISFVPPIEWAHTLLWGQVAAITLFLCYQIIYWNFLWKPKNVSP